MRAPKGSKILQVGPVCDATQLARRTVGDSDDVGNEPVAREYLVRLYVRPYSAGRMNGARQQ